MQHNIIKLTLTFVLLFSLQGFAQTTEKSEHPLLDKYYPRSQNTDTAKSIVTQTNSEPRINPEPQINPAPEIKPAPVITTTVIPAATTTPVMASTETPTTPAPVMTSTVVPTAITTPGVTSTTAPVVTVKPVMTTTTTINKPTLVSPMPPAKKVSTQPLSPPYMDTRLGSSTKQYDTWEKNSNGAGSVTTNPKG